MELKDLQKHIRHLVTLEITEAPVISCYFNLDPGVAGCRQFMEARATSLRKSLPKATQRHFEDALRLNALRWGQADVLILAMVRRAERNACKVEIVNHSEVLMAFAGAGCLLRYSSI